MRMDIGFLIGGGTKGFMHLAYCIIQLLMIVCAVYGSRHLPWSYRGLTEVGCLGCIESQRLVAVVGLERALNAIIPAFCNFIVRRFQNVTKASEPIQVVTLLIHSFIYTHVHMLILVYVALMCVHLYAFENILRFCSRPLVF